MRLFDARLQRRAGVTGRLGLVQDLQSIARDLNLVSEPGGTRRLEGPVPPGVPKILRPFMIYSDALTNASPSTKPATLLSP